MTLLLKRSINAICIKLSVVAAEKLMGASLQKKKKKAIKAKILVFIVL